MMIEQKNLITYPLEKEKEKEKSINYNENISDHIQAKNHIIL
jgi:hypothetical protein